MLQRVGRRAMAFQESHSSGEIEAREKYGPFAVEGSRRGNAEPARADPVAAPGTRAVLDRALLHGVKFAAAVPLRAVDTLTGAVEQRHVHGHAARGTADAER